MSNETFSAAIFIVTSILVAVVLANALFPAVIKSVQSSELSSDSLTGQLNTQLSVSETVFYKSGDNSHLIFYLKNTGQDSIPSSAFNMSETYVGNPGEIFPITIKVGSKVSGTVTVDSSYYTSTGSKSGDRLEKGEILFIHVTAPNSMVTVNSGDKIYFSMTLPNRYTFSQTFTVK